MVYSNDFLGEKLSALGFGTMRLPLAEGGRPANINQAEVDEMVDYAIAHGVNYFDTALPYHESLSEVAIGKSLSRYPRETWNIADKFPGHQIMSEYDVEGIFEDQLRRCGVDYFDFYLFHNVNDSSLSTYLNPEYNIIDRVIALKKQGKIRHLGFSCHGGCECIQKFVDAAHGELEFCQIQLNYVDWTLQNAKDKYELLTSLNLPVWVMEPCRGGKLANLNESLASKLKALDEEASIPSWAFRFLQSLPNVKVVLSGMIHLDQMEDNCRTFGQRNELSEQEENTLFEIAEVLKNAVPCTGCRYCCDGCPMEIDIPRMIAIYNDYNVYPSVNINIALASIDDDKLPKNCIGCGQCAAICPQRIDVPDLMIKMNDCFSKIKPWAEICKEREEAAKKGK